jgi:HK97 family phage major capsid protein
MIIRCRARAEALVDRVRAEGRDFSEGEKVEAARLTSEAKDLAARKRDLEAREARLAGLDDAFPTLGVNYKSGGYTMPTHPLVPGASVGGILCASSEYAALQRATPSELSKIELGPVPIPGGISALMGGGGLGAKVPGDPLTTGSPGAGGLIPPGFFLPPAEALAFAVPLTLRNLVTVAQTQSDLVNFARTLTWNPLAVPVAEAAAKPASELTFEQAQAQVRTIASWLPCTKQALADAGQLLSLVDNFLTYAVGRSLEDQMINGDGTAQNFMGLLHDPKVQVLQWNADLLTTARNAKRLVETVGADTATAYVVSPAVDEQIELLKDTQQRFYGAGPFGQGPASLWGLPRVISHALPDTVALCGDMRSAVLWDRLQAAVSMSDSHQDFFIKNMVAILAEGRAAFGIVKPQSIVRFATTSAVITEAEAEAKPANNRK